MKLWAIAFNSFRENIRERVLYSLLVFAILMIGTSIALGQLSMSEQERITIDLGLASISIFGVLMAVFLGIGLVSKEIDKKTIYTLIAKPLPRYLFILGRFAGLMITIGVNVIIMTMAFALVLWYISGGQGWPLSWPIVQAVIMIYVELAIVTAAAMVFSSFSTPTLSVIFTLCFFLIGRLTQGIGEFGERSDNPIFHYGAKTLVYLVPNLNNYVQIESALYGDGIGADLFGRIIVIGLLTVVFFLIISIMIFQRRDFV